MRYCYIIVDGLGFEQIQRAQPPFLLRLATQMDIKRLPTLLAYSSGIYPSIWSGRYPEEHMVWSEFYFNPGAGQGLTDVFQILPNRWDLQRKAKYITLVALAKLGVHPKDFYGIPPPVERYFGRVRSQYRTLPPVQPPGIDMISDVMNDAGHRWEFVYTSDFIDHAVTDGQIAAWSGNDSLFYYVADVDEAGHRLGPDTAEYRRFLLRFDDCLREFVGAVEKANPEVVLYLFSDHGMNAVHRTLDLWDHLERSCWKLGHDYVAFFNSTLASFWFLSAEVERGMRETLAGVPGGRVLGEEDQARYRLRFADRRYGDLLFLADPGVEIIPNFMSLAHRASLGMHGYAPEDPDTSAFLIGPGAKIASVADVTEIFHLVKTNVDEARRLPKESVAGAERHAS